jgi:hypothetical protein
MQMQFRPCLDADGIGTARYSVPVGTLQRVLFFMQKIVQKLIN